MKITLKYTGNSIKDTLKFYTRPEVTIIPTTLIKILKTRKRPGP